MYMRQSHYIRIALLGALCLHVGCGEADDYTVVRGACAAIVQGSDVGDGPTYSTVQVGNPGSCTGVYIAPGVVLTAAHCGNPAYVRVGNVIRSNILYVPHPDYPTDPKGSDLALLFLDGELPSDIARIGIPDYGSALVQGYGTDGVSAGVLRYATTHIESFWAPNTLVTSPGPDTCFGDSGGPIYQSGAVVGITRSGLPGSPASIDACGQGGMYTIIHSHKAWLDSEVDHLNWISSC